MHHIDSNSCVSSWTEQFEGVVFAYGSLWFRESIVLGPFCGVDAVDGRRVSFDYLSVNVDSSNCLIDGEIGWILLVLLSSIIVGWGISEIVHWFVKLFLEVDVVWDIVGSSFVEDWIESSLVCNDGGCLGDDLQAWTLGYRNNCSILKQFCLVLTFFPLCLKNAEFWSLFLCWFFVL